MEQEIKMPDEYTPVEAELPPMWKRVIVFMSDGKVTTGYRYENYNREGWMTDYHCGLFANQIWSGKRVLGWIKN